MNATEPAPTAVAASTERPNLIKRLYNWVLHWADTRYGVPALFVLAFLESSFFPIPPDVLLIALCMGAPKKSFKFAGWCAVGSVLGGIGGYYIGYLAEPLGRWIIFDLLHYVQLGTKLRSFTDTTHFLRSSPRLSRRSHTKSSPSRPASSTNRFPAHAHRRIRARPHQSLRPRRRYDLLLRSSG
jgi:hypothetical protein